MCWWRSVSPEPRPRRRSSRSHRTRTSASQPQRQSRYIVQRSPPPERQAERLQNVRPARNGNVRSDDSRALDVPDAPPSSDDRVVEKRPGGVETLEEAIASSSIHRIKVVLDQDFDTATNSELFWVRDYRDARGTEWLDDVATVLLEENIYSPWIRLSRPVMSGRQPDPRYHYRGCSHGVQSTSSRVDESSPKYPPSIYGESASSFNPRYPGSSGSQAKGFSRDDIALDWAVAKSVVEQLCGLGGVLPIEDESATWYEDASCTDGNSTTTISYSGGQGFASTATRRILIGRVRDTLTSFLQAAWTMQRAQMCCNGFTILVRGLPAPQSFVPTCEIHFIHFDDIKTLRDTLISYAKYFDEGPRQQSYLRDLNSGTAFLMRHFGSVPDRDVDMNFETVLNRCCLVAQVNCVGILSYAQAHVGPLQPHFVDTAQKKLVLLGAYPDRGDALRISAQLVRLTCLDDMLKKPVLVFTPHHSSRGVQRMSEDRKRHSLVGRPKDLLDTFGSGRVIRRRHDQSDIIAISMLGGLVHALSLPDSFHWSPRGDVDIDELIPFPENHRMYIGEAVTTNASCKPSEADYRARLYASLQQLDVRQTKWQTVERGLQLQLGGDYGGAQFSVTQKVVGGVSRKESRSSYAEHDFIEFLNERWGLQISLCSKVARRVTLRHMVADLLEIFATRPRYDEQLWAQLKNIEHVLDVLKDNTIHLGNWIQGLPNETSDYLLERMRQIFRALHDTGVSTDKKTFKIGWPVKDDIHQCVTVRCQGESSWLQVLADSGDTATFAYMVPRCLQKAHRSPGRDCTGGTPTANMIDSIRGIGTAMEVVIDHVNTPGLPIRQDGKYYVELMDGTVIFFKVTTSTSGVTQLVPCTSPPRKLGWRLKHKQKHRLREAARDIQHEHVYVWPAPKQQRSNL